VGETKNRSIFFFKSVRGVHSRAIVKRRNSETLETRAAAQEVSNARFPPMAEKNRSK